MHAPPLPQLLTAYEQIKSEVDASRGTAVAAVEKEHKAARIVASLTAVSPLGRAHVSLHWCGGGRELTFECMHVLCAIPC